jgi:leucyl aminopeptidase (aminopeptidase T)
MMKRTLNADFNKIRFINERLITKLKNKNQIKITTKKGTDMKFDLKGRKWISDDGIYTKMGAFGNLPAGEIFIAPLEGKTNGKIICDASVGGLGKVDKNIEIIVKNGFIESVKGGKTANQFKKLLKNRKWKFEIQNS